MLPGQLRRTIFNATRKHILFRIGLGRPEAVSYPHVRTPVFADIVLATDYLDLSEGLDAQAGWKVVEVGMGELVALCAAFGIGYVALPTSPGLGRAGVGPVLDVADALARLG